jgi:hypothetical protein
LRGNHGLPPRTFRPLTPTCVFAKRAAQESNLPTAGLRRPAALKTVRAVSAGSDCVGVRCAGRQGLGMRWCRLRWDAVRCVAPRVAPVAEWVPSSQRGQASWWHDRAPAQPIGDAKTEAASADGQGKPALPGVRVKSAACTPRTHEIETGTITPTPRRPETALQSRSGATADPPATAADASHPGRRPRRNWQLRSASPRRPERVASPPTSHPPRRADSVPITRTRSPSFAARICVRAHSKS